MVSARPVRPCPRRRQGSLRPSPMMDRQPNSSARSGGALRALSAFGARGLRWVGLATAMVLGGAGGCAFQQQREVMHALAASGSYAAAAAELDRPDVQSLYGERNRLLWLLDRGAIALALGDTPRAIEWLSQAETIMDWRREASTGDAVVSWLLNDAETTYIGEPYEDLYTNTLKLLAQLRAGRIENGATVEARRAAGKADWLRDRFERELSAARARGGASFAQTLDAGRPWAQADDGTGAAARRSTTADGQFVESTLATYLTAVTFMKAGEPELQAVAGRRLADSIRLQGPLIGDVRAEPFERIGQTAPEEVNVLLVSLSGPAPVKDVRRVGPIPAFTFPVYFELPVLRARPSRVSGVEVVIEPEPEPTGALPVGPPVASLRLDLVENLASVAAENHRRQMPVIYARTLLRAGLKSGAAFAGAEVVRRRDKNGLATAGVVLGGLALLALTERADTRAWAFLPGQAHVAVTKLPPGRYRATVRYLGGARWSGPDGGEPRSQSFVVGEGPGALSTVVWTTAQ